MSFRKARSSTRKRSGFTLVEMLVVLVIIGILMAFLIPMVLTAIRKARNTQIKTELTQLEQACEAFHARYGTYPPDGSNGIVVRRVIGKMFPRIIPAEVNGAMPLLATMDPAEALPFWLGGFSDDPKRPFSGPGGPMNATTERSTSGFFEFQEARLTLRQANPSTGLPDPGNPNNEVPWSYDEEEMHGQLPTVNDMFPVYKIPRFNVPYVYFDARTYIYRRVNGPLSPIPAPPHFPPAAFATTTSVQGLALPYRSDKRRKATPDDPILFEFVKPKTFQILSCGLDEDFGNWQAPNVNAVLTAWPQMFKRFPSRSNYADGDDTNIANFADGMLEDSEE